MIIIWEIVSKDRKVQEKNIVFENFRHKTCKIILITQFSVFSRSAIEEVFNSSFFHTNIFRRIFFDFYSCWVKKQRRLLSMQSVKR